MRRSVLFQYVSAACLFAVLWTAACKSDEGATSSDRSRQDRAASKAEASALAPPPYSAFGWVVASVEEAPYVHSGPLADADQYEGRCFVFREGTARFPWKSGGRVCERPRYSSSRTTGTEIASDFKIRSGDASGRPVAASAERLGLPEGDVLDIGLTCERGRSFPFSRLVRVGEDRMWAASKGTILHLERAKCDPAPAGAAKADAG